VHADRADVRIATTPDMWNIVMIRQAVNPMVAMLTGKMRVKGFTKMGKMRKLFPPPSPDQELTLAAFA
jgi:putative sterol carrier protein